MKDIVVTAVNTDTGKTWTMVKLIYEIARRGLMPGVFKPIETGVHDIPADASLLLDEVRKVNKNFLGFDTSDICPVQYALPAAPYVAANGKAPDYTQIMQTYTRLKNACDVLLIEGAGGLLVPIEKSFFMSDLFTRFDARLLLVTHDRLGCINDTLLNLYYLQHQKADFLWCVNLRDHATFDKITRPFYEAAFGTFLTLPDDLGEIVDRLLSS